MNLKNKLKCIIIILIFIISLSSCSISNLFQTNGEYVSFDTINSLEETAKLGHVRVTLVKNIPFGGDITMGSGTIISEDDDSYYILTNNHVIYYDGNSIGLEYKVTDAYMNTYYATLLKKSAEYDLAVLQIKKGNQKLYVFEYEDNVNINDTCIAIGDPKGQISVCTIGKIKNYSLFNPIDDEELLVKSNVCFEVYTHTAKINNGSSGGALLNEKLKLIGINFASAINKETQEFIKGYAIPINKALEFINE